MVRTAQMGGATRAPAPAAQCLQRLAGRERARARPGARPGARWRQRQWRAADDWRQARQPQPGELMSHSRVQRTR